MMIRAGIPADLFFRINPSLHADTCDSELVQGNAYCLSPTLGWSYSSGDSTDGDAPNSTAVAPPPASSSSYILPSPTSSASECASFYIVQHGDSCPLILLKFLGRLDLESLLEWNLGVGFNCGGLKVGMMICVGY